MTQLLQRKQHLKKVSSPVAELHFYKPAAVLAKVRETLSSEDEKTGIDILYKALGEPVRWIAKNAGADDGWVLKTIEESKAPDFGFNAMTMEFGSMLAAGVLDPAKVTRTAVQNAASIGMMILTTEALITDIPEKKECRCRRRHAGWHGRYGRHGWNGLLILKKKLEVLTQNPAPKRGFVHMSHCILFHRISDRRGVLLRYGENTREGNVFRGAEKRSFIKWRLPYLCVIYHRYFFFNFFVDVSRVIANKKYFSGCINWHLFNFL